MNILEIPELRRVACVPDQLTNHQVDALKRSRENYSQQILILDERKEELIKKLSEIDQERSRLLDCVKACQQALSPMNHVPDDILREIFLQIYLCFPQYCEDDSFSLLRPPIVISHVCRRWRTVANDFAVLWTKLRTNRGTQHWDQRGLELLAQWLQRAKGTPLNLQLVLGDDRAIQYSSDLQDFKFIAQLIEPIGGSLTRLFLKYVTVEGCSRLSLLPLPSLEQLVIILDDSAEYPETFSASFDNTPALRRISFSGSFEESLDRKVLLPWNQLTHFLNYSCPDYFEFFLLTNLFLCTQLRFLFLGIIDCGGVRGYLETSRSSVPKRIVIPSLETLALDFSTIWFREYANTNPYPNIFFPFEFPNLRKLVLLFNHIAGNVTSPFLDELRRLKNLEHFSIAIQEDDALIPLQAMLQALPHIKTLELSLSGEYTPAIAQLTALPGQQGLLPNLHTLALMFDANGLDHDKAFLDPDTLVRFVESRTQRALATRLEKFTIVVCSLDGPDYATLDGVRKVLRPYIPKVLVWSVQCWIILYQRWIHVDPELEGRPELLELV
ncbi:hypothetical protein EST38_g6466 [Candolleomyces aberdarensis]|uniref:Uncharacterized protein n=1 Tax=Candolleomyces aberdarensis TaxID=2316362 RepID=A0A4Q2DJT5_9AGAR|nr:hypothetical protein EST38_g6466 [Candolleomyces aberdarensis]